jgi:glycosyltransferase involved in cell wall biosynthesis
MTAPNPSPRLSIIVATFNAGATLEACLGSVFEQQFSDWELLVVDGASSDGTLAILEKHADRIAYWHSHPDKGIYDAWNQALRRARGDYVCFLGADDHWFDPSALATLFAAIGTASYDLVSSRASVTFPSGRQQVFGTGWDYKRFGRRMGICHPGLLHRRALFDEYGLFDHRYRIVGDLDFLLRLPASTQAMHVDNVAIGIGGGGISRDQVMLRLREQRQALSRCPRFGTIRAHLIWLDKLWRYPVARLLNLPY